MCGEFVQGAMVCVRSVFMARMCVCGECLQGAMVCVGSVGKCDGVCSVGCVWRDGVCGVSARCVGVCREICKARWRIYLFRFQ